MAGFRGKASSAVALLLVACLIPACGGDAERSSPMEAKAEGRAPDAAIPPIDAAAPEEVVSAMFAFG